MWYYLQLGIITATTVGKVLLCAVIGMFASRYFVAREKSEKGLSYISVNILLPCLVFSNLCLNISWESLGKFYWAPLLACVPQCLGVASSLVFRLLLEKKYHALIMLGCTFQNGLTFPLSIILNLKGISWLDKEAVDKAQSYIFLYSIVCVVGLWTVGEPLIGAAKAKEDAEREADRQRRELRREKRRTRAALSAGALDTDEVTGERSFVYPFQEEDMAARAHEAGAAAGAASIKGKQIALVPEDHQHDRSVTDAGTPASREATGSEEADTGSRAKQTKRTATATEQLAWYKPAKPYDHPIKPPKPATVYTDEHGHVMVKDPEAEEAVKEGSCSPKRIQLIFTRAFNSPPVVASFTAIFISLIPPLRWVAASFGGQTLIGGLTVVGAGAIPLQLLVLGCTIVSSKPQGNAEDEEVDTASDADDEGVASPEQKKSSGTVSRRSARPPQKLFGFLSQSTLFIICAVALRMVVLPFICFVVIHVLRKVGLLPDERPFLLAMLVATSSPAAINSSVICSMHDYYAREFARMIFFMYITAIVMSTVWLFVTVSYLNAIGTQ